jgi:ribonucleoside-diphosphate reductase alpha chain
VQAAFQRHVDNAVSKTVNLPADATPAQVREIYVEAWRLGLKGVTVFREGCRARAVLERGTGEATLDAEDPGDCPRRVCN